MKAFFEAFSTVPVAVESSVSSVSASAEPPSPESSRVTAGTLSPVWVVGS